MKIMAATFNGVAPSRDDYKTDAEYQEAYADYTDLLKDTKAPFAGFNNQRYSVEVAVILAFDFVKTPDNDYIHYNLRCTCIFKYHCRYSGRFTDKLCYR